MKLLFTIILLTATFSFSQDIDKLIEGLSSSKELKHAVWGVYAEYTDNGEKIISVNEDKGLAPASGLKVFTSTTALSVLGEDFRYVTKLYYDGEIENGILGGNIYIVGSGDPTLGSDQVKGSYPLEELMRVWQTKIKGLGIREIKGSVIADELIFENDYVPDYWPWIDIGNYYGAGTSGLCINDNLYYLYFKPSASEGGEATVLKVIPPIDGLEFLNNMRTGAPGSGDNGYIYRAPGSYSAYLKGTIPAGVDNFPIKGSIPDPALFAAQYLTKTLLAKGIKISGEADKLKIRKNYNDDKLITETKSALLKDIVYIVNKKSNNLYTEQILKTAALKAKGKGSTGEGVKLIEEFFNKRGIPTGGLDLYDGSGLSRTNQITALMMTKLLTYNTKQKYFNTFYNSLVVLGDKNDPLSYQNMCAGTPAEKNARIKSGTINGVRSHSGYVRDLNGRLISFSLIVNNYSGSSSSITKMHEKIIAALAGMK